MIKDILLFLDDSKTNSQRIQLGLNLAQQHQANLTAAAFGSMKPIHAPKTEDEKAVYRMSERMAEKIIDEFKTEVAATQDAETKTDTLIIFGDTANSASKIAHYSRNYDLVILSQPNPQQDNYHHMLEKAQQVLLYSGRPVLFIPYTGAKNIHFKKAMIAWDGTPSVSRSVHDAIALLRKVEKVIILVVESVKQQEIKKEVLVEGLATHLGNHDVNVEIHKVNPGGNSVTSVIQNQISDQAIDLLIMGGHGTPTLTQKIFGTVTSNLLSSLVVPVLISN